MQIAICSDIHDNIWALEKALNAMRGADALIFCGDFCAPFTLTQIAEGFAAPIHAVFGNNDGDPRLLVEMCRRAGNFTLHGQFADLELGGLKIAVNHYPEIARPIAASGQYDVVCFGHNHQLSEERIGSTLLINPGEIMGRFGRRTFMMLDTDQRTVLVHEVN